MASGFIGCYEIVHVSGKSAPVFFKGTIVEGGDLIWPLPLSHLWQGPKYVC
jgi:hypothetical protein